MAHNNTALTYLAQLLQEQVLKQNATQAKKAQVPAPSPLEEAVAEKVNYFYAQTGNEIYAALAEIIGALDATKYANVKRLFDKKSGRKTPGSAYESFTMLVSLSNSFHAVSTGTIFMVTHGKQKYGVRNDGTTLSYDSGETSVRIASKEEVEKFFNGLKESFIKFCVQEDGLLAPYFYQAVEKAIADGGKKATAT